MDKFENSHRLDVFDVIGDSVMELVPVEFDVETEDTEGDIKPKEGRDGVVVGKIRFTPCFWLV
jgi:hypothetical protein